jgi:hypothetical protein
MAKVYTKSRGVREDGSPRMPKVILNSQKVEFIDAPIRKDGYVNRKELRDFRTGRIERKKFKKTKQSYTMGVWSENPTFIPKRKKIKGWMRDKKGKYVKPNNRKRA